MPNKKENLLLTNKKDLFQFLNSRFEKDVMMFDEGGQQVTDYKKVVDFMVPFTDKHGHKVDTVNITLDPDTEGNNEEKYVVKLMFTKDMLNSGHLVNNKFDKFEKDLIAWTKSRMINFKPVPVDIVVKRHKTMESKFGPLSGSVKTSTQTLENAKLIIKHTDTIDENIRGARTRKIHKIYVENSNGEKFLLPYKNMRGARAMARHVNFGGNPYDKAGQSISNSVSEAIALSKFVRKTRNKTFDQLATEMVEAAQIRLMEVKKQLSRLSSERGYTKYKEELVEQQEIEFNEDVKSHFIQNKYDEALDECLPFVWGAYKKMSEMREIKEFKNWVEEAIDPRLDQAVKQATNSKTPPVSVVTDKDGTQELQANPADPKTNDALKQISKNMGGKLPPVSIKKVTEVSKRKSCVNCGAHLDPNDSYLKDMCHTCQRESQDELDMDNQNSIYGPRTRSDFEVAIANNPARLKRIAGIKNKKNKVVNEDGPLQFTVTFTKPGKKLIRTINAASKESAELEAYNLADKHGWGIKGDVVPVQEALGGDKADDFVNSVRSKDQPIVEYLTQENNSIDSILKLNLFQDLVLEDQWLLKIDDYEGGQHPEFIQMIKEYVPVAKKIRKKINQQAAQGRLLSDEESKAIDEVWYDGSDIYNSTEEIAYDMPEIYNNQIIVINKILNKKLNQDQPIVEDDELNIDIDNQDGEMSLDEMCQECGVYFDQDAKSAQSECDPTKCRDCAGECEAERHREREAGVKYEYTDKVDSTCGECGAFLNKGEPVPQGMFYSYRSEEYPKLCQDCAEFQGGGTNFESKDLYTEEFNRLKNLLKY
jgi:hypothetical protein